jgi:hypothetical protein
MDYSSTVEPFLGQDPTSLRDVALERVFPFETLQSIASRPDSYGFQRIGETATDKDFIPKQDLRLKTRILMDAVGPPDDPSDKTWWVVPCVLYRGLPEFSVTELVVPCAVLKRCTATSELDAMGMYKLCRSYSPQMYGGAIDVSAELLQRAQNVEQLQGMFEIKVNQLVGSLQMTFRNIIYGHLFAGPPLEYTEMRKIYTDSVSKRDLFISRYQKRIDNFICWNFRQTDPNALLIDLDNSLKFDVTIGGKGAADTFVMHPIMINRLMDRLYSVDFEKAKRQVYYKCTNFTKKELEKKDIFTELTGATKNDAPNFAIVVSGDFRYVVPTPNVTVEDERSNPAELDAHFKSFAVIGTTPTRSMLPGSMNIAHVQSIDWNTIWVTDLDRGVDAPIKLVDVMVKGGYFHEETYNADVYNSLFESSHALVELRNELPQGAFYDDLDMGYDTRKKTVLFRPSRKVYYDPQKRVFLPSIAYGHSDVCTSPIAGDIVAAMTLMRETQFHDDTFDLESTYLRTCMKLEWTEDDRRLLKDFYETDFEILMDENRGGDIRGGLLEDVMKNDGFTHFVNYDQLLVILDVLQKSIERAKPPDRVDVMTKACIAINRILDFVSALANAYSQLVVGDEGYTHTLLCTSFGRATLQRLFVDMEDLNLDNDLLRCAIIYHRIVLRLLSPSIVSIFQDPRGELFDHVSFHEGVGHTNLSFRCISGKFTYATLNKTTTRPGENIYVVSEYSPYDRWTRSRQNLPPIENYDSTRDLINYNYSYRVDRITNLPQSFAVRSFALLFLSCLQNPNTTRMLASRQVYVNTAFLLYRNVYQRTCSLVLCRSGMDNRALFVGNGKRDTIETSAAAYKTNVRIEAAYVDFNEQNNTRVQHHVAGLGYVSGMGSEIFNPDQPQLPSTRNLASITGAVTAEPNNGDFLALPLPSATDPASWDYMQPVNGRASQADGNQTNSITDLDEIYGQYTTNPFATTGFSEAQIVMGSVGHPLWSYNPEPAEGVYTMFLNAHNPSFQIKSGFDQFQRPVPIQHLKSESNIACQGRQYVEGAQHSPLVFKTLNKGFYGPNEHSESSFKNTLDISTVRSDEGVWTMDPFTCKLSRDKPIATGMKKMFPPLRKEPGGMKLCM